jgi:hypothetical protein
MQDLERQVSQLHRERWDVRNIATKSCLLLSIIIGSRVRWMLVFIMLHFLLFSTVLTFVHNLGKVTYFILYNCGFSTEVE